MRILSDLNQPNIVFGSGKSMNLPANTPAISKPQESADIEKKEYKTGSSVAIATLAAVCGIFMFSRGFQKNANKYLNKIKEYLEEKSSRSTFKGLEKRKKMYEFFIRRVNSFIKKSESINNITSLKDVLFMKLMYKTKPTKSVHEAITKYFEKISQKTVFDAYEKTEKDFDRMYKIFDELDELILKNSPDELIDFGGEQITKRELVQRAKDLRETSKLGVDAFINKSSIKSRYDYIKEVTSSLYTNFWDASFKDFWSADNKFKHREMWQTFIAAEQVRGDKTHLAKMIAFARNAITYNKNDEAVNLHEYIKAIDNIIPVHDKEAAEIISNLDWLAANPDIFEKNRELFFKELSKLEAHKFSISSDKSAEQTLEEYKKTNIDLIDWQINDNKEGILQDMLKIYYKIAPFELEKKEALSAVKRAVKSFDESVNLECVEFFDKVRDLQLGSAPTDVLTILLSFITLSYGLGHAKDRDKQTSIMFRSGIPIVGGIAAATYSATKLVSGGKSLALGFLSGIILNRLGVIADNIRKNRA